MKRVAASLFLLFGVLLSVNAQYYMNVFQNDGKRLSIPVSDINEINYRMEIPPVSISLDSTTIHMTEGDNYTFKATILPENATLDEVFWSTNNPNVATVNDGLIRALSEGTAIIRVTLAHTGQYAECVVLVQKRIIPVASLSLSESSIIILVGDSTVLDATIIPDSATYKDILWTSENTTIAVVESGLVKALNVGETKIKVATHDGKKCAECKVVVTDDIYDIISFDSDTIQITEGDRFVLKTNYFSTIYSSNELSWSSSDSSVATVDNGAIKAITEGMVVIKATLAQTKKYVECIVIVQKKDNTSNEFNFKRK